jgi:hypothetical protein
MIDRQPIEAAQERPKWVLVAEAPEEWKDGRRLLAKTRYGYIFLTFWTGPQWKWSEEHSLRRITHLCDCIPRDVA